MRKVLAVLLLAVGSGTAVAQPVYTFEMRLIADGMAGAPAGPGQVYNIGNPESTTATRIGFWLQARVRQTGGENWGIVRASSPVGGTSEITVINPAASISLSRGVVNAAGTRYGRGNGYRVGGVDVGGTGNTAESAPFPGLAGNENGGIDNGGTGEAMTRIYGFDAYVGAARTASFSEDIYSPWGVNGASNTSGADYPSVPVGLFSPWANLYRFYLDINFQVAHFFNISATAALTGSMSVVPASPGSDVFLMQTGATQTLTATYTFFIPTPSTSAMLGLGAIVTLRRRVRASRPACR